MIILGFFNLGKRRSCLELVVLSLLGALFLGWIRPLRAAAPPRVAPAAMLNAQSLLESARSLLAANVKEQVARLMKMNDGQFAVEVEQLQVEPALRLNAITGVRMLGLGAMGARKFDGLFTAPLQIFTKQGNYEVQAIGVLRILGPAYIVKRNLTRGQIVSGADLSLSSVPWKTLPPGAAGTRLEDLVGLRVRSLVEAGTALSTQMLDEPFAVNLGDMVELTVFSGQGVLIKSRGLAKQPGKVGDQISLEQPDTKKIMHGEIIGQKSVEVRL